MFHISVFSDEITADLATQLEVMRAEGIRRLDIRSAWGKGILAFTEDDLAKARGLVDVAGAEVHAIGSPIGKTPIDGDESAFHDRVDRAIAAARALDAKAIRVFSFYLPEGEESWDPWKETVFDRCRWMADRAGEAGVVLHHENERGIFGEGPEACEELVAAVDSPSLRGAFDFANFVQAGIDSVARAWEILAPSTVAFHLKDARRADGVVMPAGEGNGDVAAILALALDAGGDYPVTIEPHLNGHPDMPELDGAELFIVAADAMKDVMDRIGAEWD